MVFFAQIKKVNISLITFFTGVFFLSNCKPKGEISNSVQGASGGLAEYVFFKCGVNSWVRGKKERFETSVFNNTIEDVSLQIDTQSNPTLVFGHLIKTSTDTWVEKGKYTLKIANKSDGAKGFVVFLNGGKYKTNVEESECDVVCSGPTVKSDGRCLWSGVTSESVIGNMIIETVATAGLNTVWRAASMSKILGGASKSLAATRAGATVLSLDTQLANGVEAVSKARNYDDAMQHLSAVISKTNPLSGTTLMGKGNCANDAMTQVVALVLGRWACAIPYPKSQIEYASMTKIVEDITRLVGVKSVHKGIRNLENFAETTLKNSLGEGEIAFLFSTSSKAGHATLITKIKGQMVHINNQTWSNKFQTVADWEKTWIRTFAQDGAHYQVYHLAQKIRGF